MSPERNAMARTVFNYHEATKHHPHQFAKSPGYMDWANEPVPFRFYDGVERIPLPLIRNEKKLPYAALYRGRAGEVEPFSLESVAALLELSMGLSAWKKYGESQWALRMNPSSGNLHPTECYLILPSMGKEGASLVHYNPFLHGLEVLARWGAAPSRALSKTRGMGIVLSSIYWREAWKYGERAFRYCQHDLGHALAALRFSANLLGWKVCLLPRIAEKNLESFMGFDGVSWTKGEEEHVDCLCWVGDVTPPVKEALDFLAVPPETKQALSPNQLSEEHVDWEIIQEVGRATRSPGHDTRSPLMRHSSEFPFVNSPLSAQAIIRNRRSAQAYDISKSKIDRRSFLAMLGRTLPNGDAPFDVFPYEPETHLALFVHHVEGLEPGMYLFIRNPGHEKELRSLLSGEFPWRQVERGFPLYLLRPGDFRQTARFVSCQQDIAGDGAFSLGMVARFRPVVEKEPWRYPRLFWETGLIGQTLYLEAEAHGLRGTGIGCYLDDPMHDLLGLKDETYQSLYHFTVGAPKEDPRIQTLAPYHHLSLDP